MSGEYKQNVEELKNLIGNIFGLLVNCRNEILVKFVCHFLK